MIAALVLAAQVSGHIAGQISSQTSGQVAAPGHSWLDVRRNWAPPGQPMRSYRVRIDRPAAETSRGRAVFMFGGGLVHDLDWTTPGRFEHDGQPVQMTISGEDTTDGATLAYALVADGWTVIRYSALRDGDPLHAQSRGMAESLPFAATVELARFMWSEFIDGELRTPEQTPEQTVVLGHSLGACRGVIVSQGRAMGYVSLAGAYMSPTNAGPSRVAADALAPLGEAGADGALTEQEFAAAPGLGELTFAGADADASGDVIPIALKLRAANRICRVI